MSKPKLAVIVSHPIQHFAPVYKLLGKRDDLDIIVVYYTNAGVKSYFDTEFNKQIAWDIDLLSGYRSVVLNDGNDLPRGFTGRVRKFWKVLSDEIPDVVLCYGYATDFQWIAWTWALVNHKKVLYFSDSTPFGYRRNWLKRITKTVPVKLFFRQVDLFLSVGDRNELYLKNYGAIQKCLRRCPLSVDVKRFRESEKQQKERRKNTRVELGIARHEFVLLFSGKLINRKRPQDLVKAVLGLAERNIPVTVLLLGDGVLMPKLKKVVSKSKYRKKVRFLGFVNQSRIVDFYYIADCYVMPSERDAHPLVVTEAIACGLPVIASDNIGCIGPTDTVQNGINGFIYPTGNVEELMGCIERIRNDHELWAKMSASSYKIAETQDITVAAEAIFNAVLELS